MPCGAAGAGSICREKISGARADRPELTKLMKVLAAGDVVLVTKLDRLGRSTRELLELIERISQAGAFFKSLGDPLFDTTTPINARHHQTSLRLEPARRNPRALHGLKTPTARPSDDPTCSALFGGHLLGRLTEHPCSVSDDAIP